MISLVEELETPEACDMCLKNWGTDECMKTRCIYKPSKELKELIDYGSGLNDPTS